MQNVRHAFEDRHPAANRKNENPDDESPEVELVAVAERVRHAGRSAPAHAEKNQPAIAGVDERVDPFRQHRRAAGERSGDKLRDRNREIAGNCR